MNKPSKILNLFLPELTAYPPQAIIVGFNFENTTVVVTSIIPLEEYSNKAPGEPLDLKNLIISLNSTLQKCLQEQKFQAFSKYCACQPQVLGLVESESKVATENLQRLIKSESWLTLRVFNKELEVPGSPGSEKKLVSYHRISEKKATTLELTLEGSNLGKELIPNVVLYPILSEECFISLTTMKFGNLFERS